MSSKDIEEFLSPVILTIAPLVSITLAYLFFKGKKFKKIVINFLSGLLALIPDNKNENDYEMPEIEVNDADPNIIGTTAYYAKKNQEK